MMSRRPGNLALYRPVAIGGNNSSSSSTGSSCSSSSRSEVLPLHLQGAAGSFSENFEQDFSILGKLGSGSTSTVSRALWRADSSQVAVKVTCPGAGDLLQSARKEYEILRKLAYPTIPRARRFQEYLEEGRAVTIMDYFDGVELSKAVAATPKGYFDECIVIGFARKLMETVEHLHEHQVLHRDIKPENVLVSKDLQRICLVDFNAAHCLEEGEPLSPMGTKVYAAPEVLQNQPAGAASDIWGAGLCIYLALSGVLPQGRRKYSSMGALERQASREVSFLGQPWEGVSEACINWLSKCLAVHEEARPTAKELLQSQPWLSL